MDELALIDRLRLIATDPAARGLDDDVAVIGDLVMTHDMIAEGVHFLEIDPPASVGWKLVAVNLSDLAAKGAEPVAALLGFTIGSDSEWDEKFIEGVAAACEAYSLPLIGGDTISLPPDAPKVFGLTAVGRGDSSIPSRSGGKAGDALWVVGLLGDAAAGLAMLKDDSEAEGPLVEAYRRPVPQLATGRLLAPYATAMMDISDGLLLDASRLCAASGCGAEIRLDQLPLSRAFVAERGAGRRARLGAATGGDDYALLAALPADFDPLGLSLPPGTILARIGELVGGKGLKLFDAAGEVPLPERLGYEHRAQNI
ncbi:thiamine-phosphate kinase [Sphingomonas sp. NSE70-1]|uniref:Thiamine-monophosphate kinase n=1 Tax=Sphingomonas caseinilyticus TaxID=2908205 RepID=A0ABT0RVK2_9SPHN|nr:thiamine-phosphate kinase [Sphingomonas caseinilyticus]MCL6699024.1 thiamine-phosphate kinase [Sphingomonas caseinilyticus]